MIRKLAMLKPIWIVVVTARLWAAIQQISTAGTIH